MKALVFALLFLVPSGQTQDKPTRANNKAGHDTREAAYILAIHTTLGPEGRNSGTSNREDHKPTEEPKILGLSHEGFIQSLLALILAVITGIYVIFTGRMVKKVGAQVTIMQKQVDNAGEQLIAALKSNVAMFRQADHMNIANQQTNRLIEQAKASADATRDNVNTLIASERAWLQVKFEARQQLSTFQPPPGMWHFWFWPEVINVGRTLARVKTIAVRVHEIEREDKHFPGPPFLPDIPDYESDEMQIFDKERFVAPNDSIAPFPVSADIEIVSKINSRKFSVYLYGYVKYLDASDTERETRFCYLYWIPYGVGDPNAEGFHTPGIAPRAYTKST